MINSFDLKQIGFDSSILGYDDQEKDGNDQTALDRYLDSHIMYAEKRMKRMGVNPKTIENDSEIYNPIKQSFLNLAIISLLPVVWAKNSIGESSVDIDGMKVSLNIPDPKDKELIIKQLLQTVDRSLEGIVDDIQNLDVIGI